MILNHGPNINILLIEDNPADARLIKEMLEDDGGCSFTVENVKLLSNGLKCLKEKKFDVLLLDLGLPDSTGNETIRSVLNLKSGVPIVVLTGYADETLGIEAVKEGAQDYLVKGRVDRQLLMRSIHYAIERQKLLLELHNQSLTDFLTGLNNRRGFFSLAEQQAKVAKREKKGLLLGMIDIDDFKKINDTFGHGTGDHVLVETSRLLRETFRDSDIIGRIGGDEFAICVLEDDTVNEDILTVRLQENLKELNSKKTLPCGLSFSAGFARCSVESPRSLEELVSAADKSMYERKKNYKSQLSNY
jgi:two-component system cell cycle response regulator